MYILYIIYIYIYVYIYIYIYTAFCEQVMKRFFKLRVPSTFKY